MVLEIAKILDIIREILKEHLGLHGALCRQELDKKGILRPARSQRRHAGGFPKFGFPYQKRSPPQLGHLSLSGA